jgi:hypothetical protein
VRGVGCGVDPGACHGGVSSGADVAF